MRTLILACLIASPAWAADDRITLTISFDAPTLAALQTRGEGVIISAYYAGEPNEISTVPADEMGRIFIGAEQITLLPENRSVDLGAGLGGSALGMTDIPMVNINVYSARWTADDNLLDCGFIDGPVADYAGTTQTIACKLIGG